MDHIYERVREAADFLHDAHFGSATTGLVLGTGQDHLLSDFKIIREISYRDIPHFVPSTVASHKGALLYGIWGETPLWIMAGRQHYYEGYDMQEVTFPVRLLHFLGVENLVLTNAAGGLHPEFQGGDLVLIRDHINLMPENPLRGRNDERLGVRFPDMSEAYDTAWRQKGIDAMEKLGYPPHTGVYAALQGPNLETPAEYRFLHTIGADLVGMSTVPEVIVARHCGMKVLAISVVSNVCYPPERIVYTTLESVIHQVHQAGFRVKKLLDVLLNPGN